jgi:hypothetical protein
VARVQWLFKTSPIDNPSIHPGHPSKKSQAIFEFTGQFFFDIDVFKLQENFSEHAIRVFLENGLGSFQTFLILQISDKPEVL